VSWKNSFFILFDWGGEDAHCACSDILKSKTCWPFFFEVFYLLTVSLSGLLHSGKIVTSYISVHRVLVEIGLYPISALYLINNEVTKMFKTVFLMQSLINPYFSCR
jgi:hypothetical protein